MIEKYSEQQISIPQSGSGYRISDMLKEEKRHLICETGFRSYEAQVLLAEKGINKTRNIQVGIAMVRMMDSTFF